MRNVIAALLAAVCLTAGTTTKSEAREAEFGAWRFMAGKTVRGTPFCSMVSATDGGIGQSIAVKVLKGKAPKFMVTLYKDTWNTPQGAYRTLMFDFADNQPISIDAYGDAHILDADVGVQNMGIFLLELSERPVLQVIFSDGLEDTWTIPYKGSTSAIRAFVDCAQK